jgi:hypothetical protein
MQRKGMAYAAPELSAEVESGEYTAWLGEMFYGWAAWRGFSMSGGTLNGGLVGCGFLGCLFFGYPLNSGGDGSVGEVKQSAAVFGREFTRSRRKRIGARSDRFRFVRG